jgi:hypothetical protein
MYYEIGQRTLCLKNKLQTSLKNYLMNFDTYNLLLRFIQTLHNRYEICDDNDLQRLTDNIIFYSSQTPPRSKPRVDDWLCNWKNEKMMDEFMRFVDTTGTYDIEKKIIDVQKKIIDLYDRVDNSEKNRMVLKSHMIALQTQMNNFECINNPQSDYIEKITENTDK